MVGSLHKTRKQIAKKRNGVVNALHVKSRDSMRLHKAGVRDQRIEKLATARNKKEQPLADRVAFFQQSLRLKGTEGAPDLETVQKMVESFVRQYDEEYDEVKKSRRAGRPASTREDLLKLKVDGLQEEYNTRGFLLPDLLSDDTVSNLHLWEGSWSYLSQLRWIKITSKGEVRPAKFPQTGNF